MRKKLLLLFLVPFLCAANYTVTMPEGTDIEKVAITYTWQPDVDEMTITVRCGQHVEVIRRPDTNNSYFQVNDKFRLRYSIGWNVIEEDNPWN